MKKNVPELRFRGFEGEWEEKKLGSLLEFKNGINADKDSYGKGIKFINVLDILNNDFISYDNIIGQVDIDNETLQNYSVTYGDVLFQRSSETREEVGTANVYLDDKTVTFGGFIIRGKKIAEYDPRFMNGVLKSNKARKQITSKSGGSTRYNVGQDILSSVRINLPSLQEQEKIANLLSKVDRYIELQEKKVSELEKYKKGMMQKIFSQKIRFRKDDGGEFPEWEEKKLGELITYKKGFAFKSDNYSNIGVRIIKISDTSANSIKIKGETFLDISKSDDYKEWKVFNEDILVSTVGSRPPLYSSMVGKVIKVPFYCDGALLNQNLVKLSPKIHLENNFLYNSLKRPKYTSYIEDICRGNANQVSITLEDLFEFKISLPCLEEQKKISKFLHKIDLLIEKHSKKLEELKILKKGLLQKMFV